jgi:uncharacterized protein (DUF486 family)
MIIHAIITLCVFSAVALAFPGEWLRGNRLAAFVCIPAPVAFTFLSKN